MALTAAIVFLALESIFGAAERTGGKDDKYSMFSSKAAWSYYIALFTSACMGATVCLAIVKARLLKLALVTALTPLAIITLSLLFDKEGEKPDAGLLVMAAVLCAGAGLAWAIKKQPQQEL